MEVWLTLLRSATFFPMKRPLAVHPKTSHVTDWNMAIHICSSVRLILYRNSSSSFKGTVVPVLECHTTKTYGGGGIVPCTLNLGTRWRWVVSFTAQPLYPQIKSPWYPLDRRLGKPQNQSKCGAKEKKIPTPARDWTLVVQIIT